MFTKSGRVFYGKTTRVVVRVCVCGSGRSVLVRDGGCLLVRFVCVIRVLNRVPVCVPCVSRLPPVSFFNRYSCTYYRSQAGPRATLVREVRVSVSCVSRLPRCL